MEVPPSQTVRARSQSTGANSNSSHLSSMNPAHSLQYPDQLSSLSPDPSLPPNDFSTSTYTSTDPSLTSSNNQYLFTTPYLSATSQDNSNPFDAHAHAQAPDQSFNQPQQYTQQQSFDSNFVAPLDQSSGMNGNQGGQYPGLHSSEQQATNFDAFSAYTQPDSTSDYASSAAAMGTNPDQVSHPGSQTISPADFSRMSSPPNSASPHLIPPDNHSSPGRPASPISSPGTFYTPRHSRHASLDPASAAYISGVVQSDWQGMLGNTSFQGHRRAPSEHSDVSSVSHSPYLPQHEAFDLPEGNYSPLLHAQPDPSLYDNAFGMEGFSLSEHAQAQAQAQHQAFSPAHSPYNISPRLSPQPQNLEIDPENPLLLAQQINVQPSSAPQESYGMTREPSNTPLPGFAGQNNVLGDMGQAAQMTPPSINVEFAPPSRTSTADAPKLDADGDTLSPPMNRMFSPPIPVLTVFEYEL